MKRLTLMVLLCTMFMLGGLNAFAKNNHQDIASNPIYEGMRVDSCSVKYGLWADKNVDAGTVIISNDKNEMNLHLVSPGLIDEIHIYYYVNEIDISITRPTPGKAPIILEDLNLHEYDLSIPYDSEVYYFIIHVTFMADEFETDEIILSLSDSSAYVAGIDVPEFFGKGAWFYKINYEIGICISSEIAWAYGGYYAIPFGTDQWGWSNGLLPAGRTYQFQLYAKAEDNILENGVNVGYVNIHYTLTIIYFLGRPISRISSANVTYVMYDGYTLQEAHIYLGRLHEPVDINNLSYNYTELSVQSFETPYYAMNPYWSYFTIGAIVEGEY